MTDENNSNGEDSTNERYSHLVGNDHAKGNNGGAPTGNDNAVGNDGGSPAKGNKNAMEHGLYAVEKNPSEVFEWFKEEEPEAYEWVLNKAAGYLEDAPFDESSPKFDQLLQVCTAEYSIWQGRGIQIEDGLIKKTHQRTPDGEMVEVEDENPVNKAVDRMENRVMQRLKKLGIFDDQSSGSTDDLENEYYTVVDVSEGSEEDD